MGYMDRYLPASNVTAGNITTPAAAAAPFDAASILVLLVTLCAFCAPVFVLFPPFPPRKSDALPVTHTRLGLQPSKSNLRNHHRAADRASSGAAEVKSLFIYPIKSCRGIEVTRAKVVHTGLEFDRLFTFAQLKSPGGGGAKDDDDQPAWEFITQRAFPLLATLEVELWQPDLEKLRGGERETKSDETFLVLRFPHRRAGAAGLLQSFAAKCLRGWRAVPEEEVLLPVAFPSAAEITAKGYTRERVRVWKDTATALNLGTDLPEALASYLGVTNRLGLFRIDPAGLRPVFRCAPAKETAGYQPVVSFQDSYPLHVLGLSSVQELENQVKKDADLRNLDPKRFRANIFVSGTPAYDEDSWAKIRLTDPSHKEDQSVFHVSCRTTRCKLPNVNPATGIRHPVEPDRTLRASREIDEGAPKKGCLGMQVTPLFDKPESPESYLVVGMSIEVLERGEHFFKAV